MIPEDIFKGEDGKHLIKICTRIRSMSFGRVVITKYRGRIASVDYTDEQRFLSKNQLRKLREEESNVKSEKT